MENRAPQIVAGPPAARPAKPRRRNQLYVVGGVLAAFALGLGWAARDLLSNGGSTANSATPTKVPVKTNAAEPHATASGVAVSPPLVVDDGRTFWVSPTDGEPLDLRYLPPGCSLILALRPRDLLSHPEADKVLAALGPRGAEYAALLEEILGSELSQVERLLVGVRAAESQSLDVCLVAGFREPQQRNSNGQWGVYSPPEDSGKTLVFARQEALREIEEQGNAPPLLRRELELLAGSIDCERQVTLLFAPNFLFADGKEILTGLAGPLREPLLQQLRDELRAISVSANWGDDFLIEVRAVSTSDLTPTQLSVQLADQVAHWPQQVEDAVLGFSVDPHGRRVVARLPAMTRVLANYTRAGVEEDQAVLRAYLPVAAGHNLLMATELLLAQQAAGSAPGVGPVASVPAKSQSVEQRLQKPTTLRFDRDTLETALRLLSEDIGVEIVLAGNDLQLEGITKNQSFGIDLAEQPAERILQEIVRLANPDKTATSLADVKQKLVYVLKPKAPGGEDVIFVTTRSQAILRGEELPAVFRPAAP